MPIRRPDIPANSSGYGGESGYIGDQIRRTNRNLLLTNALMAAILVAAFAVCGRYFYNVLFGPFPVTEQALTSTRNASELSRYLVEIPIENVMDHTVREVKTGGGRRDEVVSEYFAVLLGEKILLVKASPHHQEPNFVGSIESLSRRGSGEIIRLFLEKDPGARDAFLPIMLDTTGSWGDGYIALAIGTPLLLLNLWNVKRALYRRAKPAHHPILVSLAKYGPPDVVASQINQEVGALGTRGSSSALNTASWLLNHTIFSLSLRSFAEVVKAYKDDHALHPFPSTARPRPPSF